MQTLSRELVASQEHITKNSSASTRLINQQHCGLTVTVTTKFLSLDRSTPRCDARVLLSFASSSPLGVVPDTNANATATDTVSAAVGSIVGTYDGAAVGPSVGFSNTTFTEGDSVGAGLDEGAGEGAGIGS